MRPSVPRYCTIERITAPLSPSVMRAMATISQVEPQTAGAPTARRTTPESRVAPSPLMGWIQQHLGLGFLRHGPGASAPPVRLEPRPRPGADPNTRVLPQSFVGFLRNPAAPQDTIVPHNQDRFILLAAGPDGVFGTMTILVTSRSGNRKGITLMHRQQFAASQGQRKPGFTLVELMVVIGSSFVGGHRAAGRGCRSPGRSCRGDLGDYQRAGNRAGTVSG